MTTGPLLWPGILPLYDSGGCPRREAPELSNVVALPEMPARVRTPRSPGYITQSKGVPSALSPSQCFCLVLDVGKASFLICRGSQRPPWGSVVRQKNSQNSAQLLCSWLWFTAVEGPIQVKSSDRVALSSPRDHAGSPQEVQPTGDTRSSLGVHGISWGQSHTTADCPPPSPAPPEVKLISPTLNHVVSTNYLTRPKVLGKQRHSNQAGHSWGSQVATQELGKSQAFLWNVQG